MFDEWREPQMNSTPSLSLTHSLIDALDTVPRGVLTSHDTLPLLRVSATWWFAPCIARPDTRCRTPSSDFRRRCRLFSPNAWRPPVVRVSRLATSGERSRRLPLEPLSSCVDRLYCNIKRVMNMKETRLWDVRFIILTCCTFISLGDGVIHFEKRWTRVSFN